MATLTAQILIGSSHPNHNGIYPTHYLFLSENSRPVWLLVSENIRRKSSFTRRIIWIPTIENMLDDAFLMIAIHVKMDSDMIKLAESFHKNIHKDRLELYENLTIFQRKQLYEKSRQLSDFPKIIISVFQDSSIKAQLKILAQYRMDVEVCFPKYTRLFSHWSKETKVEGFL